MMLRRAIIFGVKGLKLTNKENIFLKKAKPWGIILFSRNIKNLNQLKSLTIEIRKVLKDKKFPILIDQEGGRVCRLNKIISLSFFSQKYFGDLYKKNKKLFYSQYKMYVDNVSFLLKESGININTVPVLDVLSKKTHKVISDRSFSKNPKTVYTLGKLCIDLFQKNKIATVIKHIPGHGNARADSHYHLPVVNSSKKDLLKRDFMPFKNSKSFFAMTAHIIYNSYDSQYTTTHSEKIIKSIIRRKIGFKGILISDDISMKSLKYNLKDNAIKALKAGCNLVLHCNANYREMRQLVKVIPFIDKFTEKKTSLFYKFLG